MQKLFAEIVEALTAFNAESGIQKRTRLIAEYTQLHMTKGQKHAAFRVQFRKLLIEMKKAGLHYPEQQLCEGYLAKLTMDLRQVVIRPGVNSV